jgi:hypothetical protein
VEKETAGLYDELTEFFSAQLEMIRDRRKNKGARVLLFDGDGNRIDEDQAAEPPPHLVVHVVEAMRLDRLKDGGATFPYPDSLSVIDWTMLDALQTARRKDNAQDDEGTGGQASVDAERARLKALVNRRT